MPEPSVRCDVLPLWKIRQNRANRTNNLILNLTKTRLRSHHTIPRINGP